MDARITEKTDVAATIEITVPAAAVDATFERVFGALARQVRVPGFRPGKAPRGVLLQRIGADALAAEVRDALVDDHYPQAVRELGLTPVHAHFHADAPAAGQDFAFTVHADLYPEFTLADPDAIGIEHVAEPVTDEDVASTLERLREDHATLVPVERGAAPGDVVHVETQGEGGGSAMPVDLDRTEPELAAQLHGKVVGDEVLLDLGPDPVPTSTDGDAPEAQAPEADAPRRTLAVKVTNVQEKDRPALDDGFAATLGFATWAEVEAEVRRQLEAERDREAYAAQRDEFVEKLASATTVPLPGALLRRRQGQLLEDLARDLQRRGTGLDDYVARLESDGKREELENELKAAAERGVKRDLVLERLLEVRGTRIDDAELEDALRHLARRERVDVAKFKRDRGDEWIENYRFLLARDRAVEELVRAKTGRPPLDAAGAAANAVAVAERVPDAADDAHDHHEHDHHEHEH